ncbi:MAG: GDP-mannose 4,6-dehydratase [Gammaproteobacteria bacterium]
MKKALITGITGQDGAYLTEFLLNKGYEVHGIKRSSSVNNIIRITQLCGEHRNYKKHLFLHDGDMTDSGSIIRIVEKVRPDEVYNLAAQSHVGLSFQQPEYTANLDALGTLRLLEAIRIVGLTEKTRFYQASTSELYGLIREAPQKETTPFYPRSPYAVSKLYAHWITINYREAYGIFACNGILFNHESPIRGETFVTRKIIQALSRIKLGLQERLYLGNLNAKRDWGHAKDYIEAMWLMLQQNKPEDYVIATGTQYSIRDLVNLVARKLNIPIRWEGMGLEERGIDERTETQIIFIDSAYFRPTEVDTLLGDSTKARQQLGWTPKISFEDLVTEMLDKDFEQAYKEYVYKKHKKVVGNFQIEEILNSLNEIDYAFK